MRRTMLAGLAFTPLFALIGCAGPNAVDPSDHPPIETKAAPDADQINLARQKHTEAVRLIREGKPEAAESLLQDALRADPAFGPAHNSLGTVFFQRAKLYQAAWEFQYAAKLMPSESEPRNNLGLVFERGGKLDDAVSWYESALKLDPQNTAILANLVRCRLRRGDRSDEMKGQLQELISRETRPQWLAWAQEQLQFFDRPKIAVPSKP